MKPTLYMLVGPKGAGKTYIGTLVDRETGIRFLRVEPIWLSLQPGEDGWEKEERAIDAMFQSHERVMIETLGAGDGFAEFHASLAKKYRIKRIHVMAEAETCLARVKSRSHAAHIAVSDEQVEQYNRIASAVRLDWDLEIENNGPASDAEIIHLIRSLDGGPASERS